ncbi:MAG: LEM-3-like GIY-YIG domain-containing protein [Gammaproteobacteria bacterium]
MDIPIEVADALGNYVYLYVDPRDGAVKYAGKGIGARAVAHLWDESESAKVAWLNELKSAKLEPRIDILARNLSEEEALLVERCAIDIVGVKNLTNKVRGHGAQYGRDSLREIVVRESAAPENIFHPVLLFRLNRSFRHNMREEEIYEMTRGVWVIGAGRRQTARYAFAVFHGIVRAVFSINAWHKAGTTEYLFRPREEVDNPKRWEFTGETAPPEVLNLYLHKSVRKHFTQGQQNPVSFVDGRA